MENVKYVGCGGDIIPQALPDRILAASPQASFFNFYGPTECTVVATSAVIPTAKQQLSSPPSIGKPIANTQIRILDHARRPVATGQTGEIYIAGAGVARGYRNNPQNTAARF